MIGVFVKRDKDTLRHIQGGKPSDNGGRNWLSYSHKTGKPKTAESHQKLGRGKKGLSARAFRGAIPLLIS